MSTKKMRFKKAHLKYKANSVHELDKPAANYFERVGIAEEVKDKKQSKSKVETKELKTDNETK